MVTSPEFVISKKYLFFMISGGRYPNRICVNLMVGNSVVLSATGHNSDVLRRVAFDLSGFQGKKARLQIIDDHQGPRGYINVDRFMLSDTPHSTEIVGPASEGGSYTMQTLTGRARGPMVIKGDKLTMGGREVPIASMLSATRDGGQIASTTKQAIRLVNGELWRVTLDSFEKDAIVVSGPLFGKREVPLKQVASIEFDTSVVPSGKEQAGTLYRRSGEPIPGKLIRIREKDVALDCVLGIVLIPRGLVTRFVLVPASDLSRTDSSTEIGLSDGSIIRGTLQIGESSIAVAHKILGTIKLDMSTILSIRNTPVGVTWLGSPDGESLKCIGPMGSSPLPTVIKSDFSRSIRMMPRTVATYIVPKEIREKESLFRAELAPIPAGRGDVEINVSAAGKVVWKKTMNVMSEPAAVSVNLPACSDFSIEVAFGGRVAIPCGVEWRDAHMLSSNIGAR